MAALLTPLVSLPVDAPATPLGIVFAMVSEVLLGALLGLAGVVCFLALQWAGLLIVQECGLAFGRIVDPTSNEQETVIGVFYIQMAVVIYLIIGGHRALIATCLDTFDTIPLLGDDRTTMFGAELLFKALTLSGHIALRVAAPTMLALFLANLALGFVSRTMPQLNVLAVGFSIKAMIAFLLMAVSLPSAADAFICSLEQVYQWLNQLIRN
ncbi:MAG: flagellar biosynthetic protein FliR [Phycisphaerae bacterium]|nr:flagellar biosynthetic protein FliR [Phycisphaerae bacterium]